MNERLSICYSLTQEVIILCLRYAVKLQVGATFTQTYFRDFRHPPRCKADFRSCGMLRNID
jgi:hypothetical protein